MLISGFSYIRNGFTFGYPFLQAFESILPICDEFVIAVGDSTDGTREAIAELDPDKIKIIDTVWDMSLRQGGRIFAQQANVALDHIRGRWGFHIQADEVIHEDDLPRIREAVLKYDDDPRVEGLLFPFLNFWGSYHYIGITRRWHRYEVRVIRNQPGVRSYRDSQGFRRHSSVETHDQGSEKGEKLRVKKIDVPVFHYNYVRHPKLMKKKEDYFHRFWHDDKWLRDNLSDTGETDYAGIDILETFTGSHPKLMRPLIEAQDWEFEFDRSQVKLSFKDWLLYRIEKLTGWRPGEYRNYRLI